MDLNDPELETLLAAGGWPLSGPAPDGEVAPAAAVSPARRAWSRRHGHAHTYGEYLVPLAGRTVYGVEGEVYPCAPGVVLPLPAGRRHDNGYPPASAGFVHLWLSVVEGRVLYSRLAVGPDHRPRRGGRRVLPLPGAWPAELSAEPRQPAAWPRALARTRLQLLVLAVARAELAPPAATAAPAALAAEVVRTVQRHIDAIHGREVTVQSVARLAGYSPYHFLRLFKRHAGCTVHEYVNRARRRRVGELLARGWSQKAIGADLGFSGPASFSRWWKRQRQRDGGDDHPAPGAPLSPD